MSAITIDGDLVHYEKLGRGRPVILVHGWLGSWRYWIPTMQQLHLKYSVYTLDLVGFGDSAKNPAKYTIDKQVLLLNQFMEQLGIPKAAMVGHGLGALVLTRFALAYPAKVARMLLVSLPLYDPGDLKERTPAGTRVLLTTQSSMDTVVQSLQQVGAGAPKTAGSGDGAPGPEATVVPAQEPSISSRMAVNPLHDSFTSKNLMALLEKCFKKSDPIFDKLRVDVEKTDEKVLLNTVIGYSASKFLDDVRSLASPTVAVHGVDDPIIPVPGDDVWNYLTVERDDVFVPIPLGGVRHFPMLEYEPFTRLTNDFLETPEISKIEVRERWRRRSR
jgi:pimeloyl-ACP methyl ester carboxylesterase